MQIHSLSQQTFLFTLGMTLFTLLWHQSSDVRDIRTHGNICGDWGVKIGTNHWFGSSWTAKQVFHGLAPTPSGRYPFGSSAPGFLVPPPPGDVSEWAPVWLSAKPAQTAGPMICVPLYWGLITSSKGELLSLPWMERLKTKRINNPGTIGLLSEYCYVEGGSLFPVEI